MKKHGHVTPNEDGSLARCGGPGICSECSQELAEKNKISDHDQKLIDDALKDAEVSREARKGDFCAALGITKEQYAKANAEHDEYVKFIGHLRPFANTPLAKESFIAGYIYASQ